MDVFDFPNHKHLLFNEFTPEHSGFDLLITTIL